mgnify:CR=1 FL=1
MDINNPNKHKSNTLNNWKRYGLIYHNFDELYETYIKTMNCGHCKKEFPNTKDRCMDHCHETGLFRKIVCQRCNAKDMYIRFPDEIPSEQERDKIKHKKYRENNRDKIKEKRQKNKDKINEQRRKKYQENIEKINESQRIWRLENKEKLNKYYQEINERKREKYQERKEKAKEYYQNNKEKKKEQERKRYQEKKQLGLI